MRECKRGPEDDRPVLRWHYVHAAKVILEFYPLPGVKCEVELRHSEVLLLDILVECWIRGEHEIDAYRGLVHLFDLAKLYDVRAGRLKPITNEAIRQYLGRMHARIAEAISEQLGLDMDFRLVECKRGIGYRLAGCGLRIEDPFRQAC